MGGGFVMAVVIAVLAQVSLADDITVCSAKEVDEILGCIRQHVEKYHDFMKRFRLHAHSDEQCKLAKGSTLKTDQDVKDCMQYRSEDFSE
jgi:hypothetical protein